MILLTDTTNIPAPVVEHPPGYGKKRVHQTLYGTQTANQIEGNAMSTTGVLLVLGLIFLVFNFHQNK